MEAVVGDTVMLSSVSASDDWLVSSCTPPIAAPVTSNVTITARTTWLVARLPDPNMESPFPHVRRQPLPRRQGPPRTLPSIPLHRSHRRTHPGPPIQHLRGSRRIRCFYPVRPGDFTCVGAGTAVGRASGTRRAQ